MLFLTVIMWVIGLGFSAVVILTFVGGLFSKIDDQKASRYLAEKYDRKR